MLQEQIKALQTAVKQLQSQLHKNSRNSSKPPSSNGLNKPAPKSLRVAGDKPTGGQKGHPGSTLCQVTEPHKIVVHDVPDHCQACQQKLPFAYVSETRQVFDLPVLQFEVTEHHAMQAICSCGQVHTAEFPAGVRATVQYGPRAQAAMMHLNQNHAVSVQRTAALMQDLFGLSVSQATVIKAGVASAAILQPTVNAIGQAAVNADVLHADETGLRVIKKLHWLHVLATDTLTWMGCHPKRGGEAFESLALPQQFKGVLVHDGWMPYKALQCQHALCNAHHLRELTYLLEEQDHAWAGDMIELLTHANHLDNLNCAGGQSPNYSSQKYQTGVRELRDLYEAILAQAEVDNPVVTSTGKRGRSKQSKATNLIGRLRDYKDDVWRFMTQPDVPFTNNLAEQAVRMPKVKQKVSGCFRTLPGAQAYSSFDPIAPPCTSKAEMSLSRLWQHSRVHRLSPASRELGAAGENGLSSYEN
ncbi:MAG: IS66 family transposase [Rhodoferax sp.]|uniref:IS66 family transposase n=2 Tax=Burkholderiales TaxID=80840 RepID=UPI0027367209|nr:IS66 family transposase [Rhodoferax sp.]MDP3337340.1 IS66 family transposase [Rhodoferax sp.]